MKLLPLVRKCSAYIRLNGWQAFFYQVRCRLKYRKSGYNVWLEKEHLPSKAELADQRKAQLAYRPKISIITPTYNTPLKFLTEMIESVLNQTYAEWELCIADASLENEEVRCRLKEYAAKDKRIKVKFLTANLGISGNSNEAAEMAEGEYIALLDHDDLLLPHALFEAVRMLNREKADVLYSDEDKIDEKGRHKYPFFKPDWSPDLLLAQNYICHLLVIKKSLFAEAGGFRAEYDGSQDYDLILRLSALTDSIVHLSKILYSWRESASSTSFDPHSKPYAQTAGLRAVNDHLRSRYGKNAYALEANHLFTYEPHFAFDETEVKVSVVIPFKDNLKITRQCVESILAKTRYSNYEIILLNNNSKEELTLKWLAELKSQAKVKVRDAFYPFNWSKLNNQGIAESDGEVLIFLNNDTEIIQGDWMRTMAENALREEIGTVGAMLLYPDGTLQHAGVVLGLNGWADHIFQGMYPVHFSTPYVSPTINRNVLASTGACLAAARSKLERLGGFNEEFIICGSDVELSLRFYEAGLRNIYLAGVRLYHLESKSRDSFIPEKDFTMSKLFYKQYWEKGDPYFNPNLSLRHKKPSIKDGGK